MIKNVSTEGDKHVDKHVDKSFLMFSNIFTRKLLKPKIIIMYYGVKKICRNNMTDNYGSIPKK